MNIEVSYQHYGWGQHPQCYQLPLPATAALHRDLKCRTEYVSGRIAARVWSCIAGQPKSGLGRYRLLPVRLFSYFISILDEYRLSDFTFFSF
jgi:hypothetical protein